MYLFTFFLLFKNVFITCKCSTCNYLSRLVRKPVLSGMHYIKLIVQFIDMSGEDEWNRKKCCAHFQFHFFQTSILFSQFSFSSLAAIILIVCVCVCGGGVGMWLENNQPLVWRLVKISFLCTKSLYFNWASSSAVPEKCTLYPQPSQNRQWIQQTRTLQEHHWTYNTKTTTPALTHASTRAHTQKEGNHFSSSDM